MKNHDVGKIKFYDLDILFREMIELGY